jgi:hypothetical protein
MSSTLSRDPETRLRVFLEAGLIQRVPTRWQLLQGQLEMLLYVILPDANDGARYAGAPLGNPLIRQPFLLAEIGIDHLRAGHGLDASLEGLIKHLNFVLHVDYPVYDLQLLQTVPGGLEALRRVTTEIDQPRTMERRRQQWLADSIVPDADRYRRRLVEEGGWIDRAAALDYPPDSDQSAYLRPEFSSLVGFMNYCAVRLPESPRETPPLALPGHLASLFLCRLRGPDPASVGSEAQVRDGRGRAQPQPRSSGNRQGDPPRS